MAQLRDLLVKTSRTFALSIPRLPRPLRDEVTIAYLLFRIADTLEDGADWPAERRAEELDRFAALLAADDPADIAAERAAAWTDDPPVAGHAGYRELLAETPFVMRRFERLRAPARAAIRKHLGRTARGMAATVRRVGASGWLELRTLEELREYCYIVAGIVGEMLTDLYLLSVDRLAGVAEQLRERAAAFGEGLQLVNILKDARDDADERRRFLPSGVERDTVLALAREDLDRAAEYTRLLQEASAPTGLVAFNAGPLLLARATLDRLASEGPGAKLSRPDVFAILGRMEAALAVRRPVV